MKKLENTSIRWYRSEKIVSDTAEKENLGYRE